MQPNNVGQQIFSQHVSFISPKKFFCVLGIHKGDFGWNDHMIKFLLVGFKSTFFSATFEISQKQ